MIEDFNKNKDSILIDLDKHNQLLVSFGGVRQGFGIPVFEFFNSIEELSCDKIFIRDFNQAWYHKGLNSELNSISSILEFLDNIIKTNQYKKISFIGNSMGGYAAILFGTLLNVDKIVTFAPQTFIDRMNRFWYRDNRWNTEISKIYSDKKFQRKYLDLKKSLSNTKYSTKIDIYFSPLDKLDNLHANSLKKMKNINLYPYNKGGHGVVKSLKKDGKLNQILSSIF